MSDTSLAGQHELAEYVDGLPNLSGGETLIAASIADAAERAVFAHPGSGDPFAGIDSAFAIALHMHQPLIPAGGDDLRTAGLISNLRYMAEHPDIGDNHNAPVFRWCYKRMGEFVPQLVDEGAQPRVMLEYSGTLLHGLREMGAHDVIDALRTITLDPRYRGAVEWLGCPWGHAVAPSTPVQDYRLHVRAWQHHFAAIFGLEALTRVRGFSPSEMALPNHPDVAYEFVRTLRDCGYRWVLVQEHTVEQPDGGGIEHRHLPHRLVCTSSRGETASIVALDQDAGQRHQARRSDAAVLRGARARARGSWPAAAFPPLVTQIADGENGGVMMNEFPPKYLEVMRECSGSATPILNGTEYLERLFVAGVTESDLPVVQPLFQHRLWERMSPGDGPDRLGHVVEELRREDGRFHMEGGSWTNDVSWVRGYDELLIPMDRASAEFHERVLGRGIPTSDPGYRNALMHLLTSETSCYRYWGQGEWTDYGAELARRTTEIIATDL